MKKIILISLCLLLLFLPVMAWAGDESLQKIEIKKTALGNQYYYKDIPLTMTQLDQQLKKVPETEPEIKKAKGFFVSSIVFAGAGGYLIGYQLGTAAAGRDPKWEQAGYGVVSIVLGGYCAKQADKHYEKAVEIYNSYVESAANSSPAPAADSATGVQ